MESFFFVFYGSDILVYQAKKWLKHLAVLRILVLHTEKDIRLRIDLIESQSSFIAKMLIKAISGHDEAVFMDYAKRLAVNRGRVEELSWVLDEKKNITSQSVLDTKVTCNNNDAILLPVREIIEKLRKGELSMDDLSADTQTMVRRGAIEMKKAKKS
jgi:hypothetical protein